MDTCCTRERRLAMPMPVSISRERKLRFALRMLSTAGVLVPAVISPSAVYP